VKNKNPLRSVRFAAYTSVAAAAAAAVPTSYISLQEAQSFSKMQKQQEDTGLSEGEELVELGSRGSISIAHNWDVGIGGDLWTTGRLMVQHFLTQPELYSRLLHGATVLELGAGAALVSLAAAALFAPKRLVISDQESHLPICEANLQRNAHMIPSSCSISIAALDWSHPEQLYSNGNGDSSIAEEPEQFDVILGMDLAYYTELHDILIDTLCKTASRSTVIILGVTKTDTGPTFFDKLHAAGFDYYRAHDSVHNSSFDARNFALFTIFKHSLS
jgi:predicted nicotinamide N-methyase